MTLWRLNEENLDELIRQEKNYYKKQCLISMRARIRTNYSAEDVKNDVWKYIDDDIKYSYSSYYGTNASNFLDNVDDFFDFIIPEILKSLRTEILYSEGFYYKDIATIKLLEEWFLKSCYSFLHKLEGDSQKIVEKLNSKTL